MDSLKHAISLIKRGCWFASVDLKDAYFSVKISPEYQKNFRFVFHGKLYEFPALPQGFRDSPRIFTKLLKPALSCLRCLGHTVLAFIDDTLLQGDTEKDCQSAMMATCQVFDSLGFTVHPVKSVLQPTQKLNFWGFGWIRSTWFFLWLTGKSIRSDQCVRNCWKWKCVPLDIWRKLLVILLRLTLVFVLLLCFIKEWRLLKMQLFLKTMVILMLPWECPTLFGRTFYGGPIMWINFRPLFKGVSLMLL